MSREKIKKCPVCGTPCKIVEMDVEKIRAEAFEEWARFAVRRMVLWSEDDNAESVDFRRGIEKACSDMCVYFRTRKKDDGPPYLERRAIEYAIDKCGLSWDNNRQRLNFYEYFEEYIKTSIANVISDNLGKLIRRKV